MRFILNFGDIFEYRDEHYVYLAQIDNLTYAAKIINKSFRSRLERMLSTRTDTDSLVFCFVVLSTPKFAEKAAHLQEAQSGNRYSLLIETQESLNEEDKNKLAKEILENRRYFPQKLVSYFENLGI